MNNYILFLITLFCWSPTWYLIKFQLGYVDPLVSVFYRFIIAAIIITAVFLLNKVNFPTPNKAIEKIIPNENIKVVK